MELMLIKITRKITQTMHEVVMRQKFKEFGSRSKILKPYMLTNPSKIEICSRVFIRGYSRIEAIISDGFTQFSPTIKIGQGTHIEQYFHLGACEYVEIGEYVLIAGRVYISDHNHRFSDINVPIKQQGIEFGGRVIIENNSWIGEGCAVLPGVIIGRNSIIGANSVVTNNIPPYSVAVGAPARVIKQYDHNANIWTKYSKEGKV